jgi:hypothetical protein
MALAMRTQGKDNVVKTSNYPQQKLLSELELLHHLERHYAGNPATRIYVAPRCYIKPDFFQYALTGMLQSFEEQEEYEVCSRIFKLLQSIQKEESLLP